MSLQVLDSVFPYVNSNGNSVSWTRGPDAFALATVSAVRLNDHGIRLFPPYWDMRELNAHGWKSTTCVVQPGMLCLSPFGNVMSSSMPPQFNPAQSGFPFYACNCSQGNTQQILAFGGRNDVSVCNVMQQGGDLVWYNNTAYMQVTGIPTWEYILISVLCIYSIRTFSNMVVQEQHTDKNFVYIIACVASILLVCYLDGTDMYVTVEDFFTFSYVCYLLVFDVFIYVFHIFVRPLSWTPSYNLVVTAFVLVSIRLYNGAMSPFIPFLIWVVAVRILVKLRTMQWHTLVYVSLFFDTTLLALMIAFGCSLSIATVLCIMHVAVVCSDVIL